MSTYHYFKKVRESRERILLLLKDNPLITPYEIAVIENGSKDFARGQLGGKINAIKQFIKKK